MRMATSRRSIASRMEPSQRASKLAATAQDEDDSKPHTNHDNTRPIHARDEHHQEPLAKRAKIATDEAKRILSRHDSDSPNTISELISAFQSKQTRRTPRDPDQSSSASTSTATAPWNPTDVEWSVFHDWPQGIALEEEEMQKYYKWLKFNHIEHETKIRFITEIVDDLTADPPREAVVYTPSDVKQRQDAMLALKAQLKQAKTQVRSLRSDIDSLTTQAARPYVTLTTSCNEAKSLLDECMDLELEVAKFTSSSAAPSSSSTSQPSVDHLDLESLPSVGTLTATEADAFCTRQEEALSALEESNTALDAEFTALKHEFKSSVKTVDRLENEVSHVAKQSNAIQGGLGKRDDKVEKVCMSHLATLDVFKSLIGLKKMEARGDTRLRLTYATHVATGEAEYILQLNFDQPGGRLVDVEMTHPNLPSPVIISQATSLQSREFAAIRQAITANDVPAVIMEGWDWAEGKSRE